MRFTAAAVVLATSVVAYGVPEVSTAYTTALVTVTACPDTVPDCPAESKTTSVSITSVPVIPTTAITPVQPPVITSVSSHYQNSTIVYPPPPASSSKPEEPQHPEQPGKPEEPQHPEQPGTPGKPEEPACPTSSVVAITKSYTTVLTSVEYSTIAVPCPTTEVPPPAVPTSVTPPPAGNTTIPPPPPVATPPPVGAAAGLTASAVFAALAGVAAFVLA